MPYRFSQTSADVVFPVPMMKNDGTQATTLAINSFTTAVIDPNATIVANITGPTITNPASSGVYMLKYSTSANSVAFTDIASANPYTIIISHPEADVQPGAREVWITDRLPHLLPFATDVGSNATAIGSLHTRVASVDTRVLVQVGSVSTQISSVDARVALNTAGIAANLVAVDSLDIRVTSMAVEVNSTAIAVSSITTGAGASQASVNSLDVRVQSLDTRVISVDANVTNNLTSVASLHTRVASVDTRVLVQVGSLDVRVTSVAVQVSSIFTSVQSLHIRVESLDVRVSSLSVSGASFADIFTTAVSESYSSVGAEFSLGQFIYESTAFFRDFTIVGSTITSKKLDGSTTAMTHGINDAVNPTANNGRLT